MQPNNLTSKQQDGKPLLTVSGLCRRFGVSRDWVYKHRRKLPHIRIGRSLRFDIDAVWKHLQRTTHTTKISAGAESCQKPKAGGSVMGKRRYQRGYVYKTGKRQKVWRVQWREDVIGADGRLRRITRHRTLGPVTEICSKAEAQERVALLLSAVNSQTPKVELTFAELVARWQQHILPTLKLPTAKYYTTNLRAHLIPVFESTKVGDLTRYDVQRFLTEKSRTHARNSLRGMRTTLGRVLGWAVENGWLTENPCRGVRLPRGQAGRERFVLSTDEAKALLSELQEPYSTLAFLLGVTGMRISEAIGLRWSDLEGDRLVIRRRVYDRQVGETKTESSTRRLPLPQLLRWRLQLLRNGSGDDWVFQTRSGTPLIPGNTLKRHLRPATRKLALPAVCWHDLRHALATWFDARGVSAKVTASVLGHADVRTTLQIYTHSAESRALEAMEQIARELCPDGWQMHHDASQSETPVTQPVEDEEVGAGGQN